MEEEVTLPFVMSEIESLLKTLLAAHEVKGRQMSAASNLSSSMPGRSDDFPSRLHSDMSMLSQPPSSPWPSLKHGFRRTDSLPSIEALPQPALLESGAAVEKQKSVSFLEKGVDSPNTSLQSQHFEMHSAWRRLGGEQSSMKMSRCHSSVATTIRDEGHMPSWYRPNWSQLWAIVSITALYLDGVAVPLAAFQQQTFHVVDVINVLTATYWLVSFPTAVYFRLYNISPKHGLAEGGADTFLLLLLYLDLSQHAVLPAAARVVLRGAQMLRLRHLPQLYYASGFPRMVHRWHRQHSRGTRALHTFLLVFVACCLLLHVLTCAWFAVGSLDGGWVNSTAVGSLPISEQYVKTMEWALSRMPPSRTTDNMLLNTQTERVTALLATALAMLCGSIFTSIATNEISDIRRAHRLKSEAEQQVADYLTTFPVPLELENSLNEYLRRNEAAVQLPRKDDVGKVLPDFLYRELCLEALSPLLEKHSFFYAVGSRHMALQYDLCHKALSDWHVSAQETLFSSGRVCENMLIVASGSLWYKRMEGYSESNMARPVTASSFRRRSLASILPDVGKTPAHCTQLRAGNWLCEPCLWLDAWQYMGKAMAESRAVVLCLSHKGLLEAVSNHKEVRPRLFAYACRFVRALNDQEEEDLTDLPIEVEPTIFFERTA